MAETGVEAVSTLESAGATIYLTQVSCDTERRILEQGLRGNGAAAAELLTLDAPGKSSTVLSPGVGPLFEGRIDDPLLLPLRVTWLPGGQRDVRLSELLLTGDPRQSRWYAAAVPTV